MGIRIPKVPQEVPVANARRHATTNMIAGRKLARPAAAPFITPPTYSAAPKSPVIFLSVVAKVRISIAGTMAIKPFGIHSIASLKVTTRLAMRYIIATISAIIPPHGSPTVASVFAKALTKLSPLQNPPT